MTRTANIQNTNRYTIIPAVPMVSTEDSALVNDHQKKDGINIHTRGIACKNQTGSQNQVSAELLSIEFSNDDASSRVKLEGVTTTTGIGFENSDGSRGLNASAIFTGAGLEGNWTSDNKENSLTLGAAAGLGLAASIGHRDIDKDGQVEHCFRASVGFFTVGACIEQPKITGLNLRNRR